MVERVSGSSLNHFVSMDPRLHVMRMMMRIMMMVMMMMMVMIMMLTAKMMYDIDD